MRHTLLGFVVTLALCTGLATASTSSAVGSAAGLEDRATGVEGNTAGVEGNAAGVEGSAASVEGSAAGVEGSAAGVEGSAASVEEAGSREVQGQPRAVLYYFHRTVRCDTCLKIEAYIDDAVRLHFGEELEEGRLLWRPTNLDEPENLHFEEEYALEYNSAVLVQLGDDEASSWQNLERVWDLLDDKEEFVTYVRSNVADALSPGDAKSE